MAAPVPHPGAHRNPDWHNSIHQQTGAIGAEFLGLRWGALTSALILFGPCLMGLGMVGPYVIKTTTLGMDRIGRTVGLVYAISTIGSVFGTILIGFYLLPILGTVTIVVSLSVLLLLMALLLRFL
ncbi:MAG: fused MFS/spermidine synthase [Verrucomicrobia bacterium]|nr:fused MFS/spermidine synthase [Verrucomicrobiota bacterium]